METDKPIQSPLDDELEQKFFAFYLAKGLLGLKETKDSFVMGICAKWGDGKTSVINMALAYLKCLYKKENLRTYEDADKIIEQNAPTVKKHDTNFWINLITIVVLSVFLFFKHFMFDYNLLKIRFWGDILQINPFLLILIIIGTLYLCLHKIISKVYDWIFLKKDSDFVMIYFNPWNYADSKEMLVAFFRAISKELLKDNSNCLNHASKLIKEYAKIAHSIDLSAIEKIFMNKSEQDIKDEIDASLKECNKKIIVIVDDLDRLIPEEILLMFKTVKIIADFPNMLYLLAYDKENIQKQFKKSESGIDIQDYIKKIVQVEKNLPLIDSDFLKTKFMLKISNIKVQNPEYMDIDLIEKMYDVAIKDKYIKNYRDLKRFFNTFDFIYSAYKDEDINIQDLIGITSVEVFESELYSYIRDNWNVFINSGILLNEKDKYISKYDHGKCSIENFIKKLSNKNINITAVLFPGFFQQFQKNIEKFNKDDSMYSFLRVFGQEIPDLEKFITKNENHFSKNYRRINNEISFSNYFKTNLEKNVLSKKEKNLLLRNLNNTTLFKQNLNKIFINNNYKLIDFINCWNSKYNEGNRTKDNTKALLNAFLSLDKVNKDLIKFINNSNNIFYGVARDIIYDFNSANPSEKITISEVYKLIQNNIENINFNAYFFVFIVYWQFKFSTDNKLSLTDVEKHLHENCNALFNEKITKEGLLESEDSCQCMAYLLEYFDCKEKIKDFCEYLLNIDNKEILLKVLCTSKGARVFTKEGLWVICEIYDRVGQKVELKNKLLNIYNDPKYSEILKKDEFQYKDLFFDRGGNIVLETLDCMVTLFNKLEMKISYNEKGYEEFLKDLSIKYMDCSDLEMKFVIENSFENYRDTLISDLKNLKESNVELYENYKEIINKILDSNEKIK